MNVETFQLFRFSAFQVLDRSCRLPLLVLFVSAAVWLVLGSAFSLIASLKFHSPNFLADCAWLTYGRVRPACNNSLLYGFVCRRGWEWHSGCSRAWAAQRWCNA